MITYVPCGPNDNVNTPDYRPCGSNGHERNKANTSALEILETNSLRYEWKIFVDIDLSACTHAVLAFPPVGSLWAVFFYERFQLIV